MANLLENTGYLHRSCTRSSPSNGSAKGSAEVPNYGENSGGFLEEKVRKLLHSFPETPSFPVSDLATKATFLASYAHGFVPWHRHDKVWMIPTVYSHSLSMRSRMCVCQFHYRLPPPPPCFCFSTPPSNLPCEVLAIRLLTSFGTDREHWSGGCGLLGKPIDSGVK